MTSAKSSFEFNESPFFARSRASSLSANDVSRPSSFHSISSFYLQPHNTGSFQSEELETPINIYHEHRGHLEQDKKARTDLNTEMLNDDLYCPVQNQEVNDNTASRGSNFEKFASFLPRFLPTTFSINAINDNYGGAMESTKPSDTWAYFHNDTNNMFDNFDSINGINSVACQ